MQNRKFATQIELCEFINRAVSTNRNERIYLKISHIAKLKIWLKTGLKVNDFVLDSGDIRHALRTKKHHITTKDLEKIHLIINSVLTKIKKGDKLHLENHVVLIIENVKNGIYIVTECRRKLNDLAMITAYRKK